jgi:hypothetical protein
LARNMGASAVLFEQLKEQQAGALDVEDPAA